MKKVVKKQVRKILERTRDCGAPVVGGICKREVKRGEQCYYHPRPEGEEDDEPKRAWHDAYAESPKSFGELVKAIRHKPETVRPHVPTSVPRVPSPVRDLGGS